MITPSEVDAFIVDVYPAMAQSGIRCDAVDEGTSLMRWPYDDAQLRPGGYISGPVQMMLADAGLWVAVFSLVGFQQMAVTTDISLTFLRPAMGGDLVAETTVVSRSRRRIHGTVRLWVGGERDRLVSHAVGTYALPGD